MRTLLEPEPVDRRRGRRAGEQSARKGAAPKGSDRWEQRFAALVAFKAKHGHCNVPSTYREDPSLAAWVFNCRRQRKQGSLDAERIKRLDAIGFAWAMRTRRFVARDWDAMVAQLEAFHREHGHSNVPNAWPHNRELAAWLHGVRCNKRSGRLSADRVRQLDALGVVWDPQQTRWEKMFAALVEYRHRYGDCNVPCGWSEKPGAGQVGEGGKGFAKARRPGPRANSPSRRDRFRLGTRRRVALGRDVRRTRRVPACPWSLPDLHPFGR